MNARYLLGAAGIAGAIVTVGQITGADSGSDDLAAKAELRTALAAPGGSGYQGASPDVYVFSIQGTANWQSGDMRAYSIGTTSCNKGDVPLSWFANTNQHPVIGQNMFRLAPGQNGHMRFEQLGQSWLKHGFCALSQDLCGDCQATNCNTLGIGCSDPYTAQRNGNQGPAGPKYQVNSSTGFYPYPPADPSYSGSIARRLQVPSSEVNAADNPNARFFFEGQYVCPDENAEVDVVRAANNASYREGILNSSGSLVGYEGDTKTEQVALYAWKAADPQVRISWVAVAGQGSVFVGSRAYDNGDGTWDYEYAVQNLDIDASIGGISIPADDGTNVSQMGYRDVAYHSGEPFNNIPWAANRVSDAMDWNSTETFAQNANANAIRWGNMFNFRFTADQPPVDGQVTLSTFKTDSDILANAYIPRSSSFCVGDINMDGTVGFEDLVGLLSEWGFCFQCDEDLDGTHIVDFNDLVILLAAYGDC